MNRQNCRIAYSTVLGQPQQKLIQDLMSFKHTSSVNNELLFEDSKGKYIWKSSAKQRK